MKIKYYAIIMAIFVFAIIAGCVDSQPNIPDLPNDVDIKDLSDDDIVKDSTEGDNAETATTQSLVKFSDINEVKKFLLERSTDSSGNLGGFDDGFMVKSLSAGIPMMETVAMNLDSVAGGVASDFSQTNVQIQDVDEGDFIKNDGKYIYMIADNKLIIIDAFDADNAGIISETRMDGQESDNYYNSPRAKELFVRDDKLVLFIESNEPAYYFQKYDIQPQTTYRQKTDVIIYDISDRSEPSVLKRFSVTGSFFQSRMIDDIVYIVTKENTGPITRLNEPRIMEEISSVSIKPEIYYFDNPDDNYYFNTITSIDVSSETVVDSKSYMLGYSNTLMVSMNNIYIAYQKQNFWRSIWGGYSGYERERFFDVIVPLLRGDLEVDIQNIINRNLDEREEWEEVSTVLGGFFTKANDDQSLQDRYEDMLDDISDALEEYDTKKALEDRKTIIHKIGIDEGNLEYKAKGEVFGSLLNQFSLDEHDGNLRVATTVNIWNKVRILHNNVYVLDENMKTIGELTGIAEDESIFSTRFMGDKLYMVTFQRVDPFFVIDLSDPENPEILGELKIPGFSGYLHPFDENHIIGVGKEADENDFGGVTIKGVKIALFDVSDVNNPKIVDQVVIGDRGSDSPVLHNHKAFLFSKSKNLLVLPVTEITQREKINNYRYSNNVWNGAYVFNIDEDGFDEIGKIEHSSKKSDYFNWWSEASVLRSLYMDNKLYTISNKYIKINDLDNELDELNTINLPFSNNGYYYWR